MDFNFKIGDDIQEVGSKKKGLNDNVKIVIVIVVSLIVGVAVFFATNALFGEKPPKTTPVTSTTLNVNDTVVVDTYKMLTYGFGGVRKDKFIKGGNINLSSFDNEERFYYAMQFASQGDFSDTGNMDANGLKIYNISNDKVNSYMKRFFGDEVTYSKESPIVLNYPFMIGNSNIGKMTYDSNRDGFGTVFSGVANTTAPTELVKPYYTSLYSATSKSDGTMQMIEKIIYVSLVEKGPDTYDVSIYKDYGKTQLIETRYNLTKASLTTTPISIEPYINKASAITYNLKKGEQGYYFVNSSFSYE